MSPKFNSYLREGTVTLREDAIVGHTRGGYGLPTASLRERAPTGLGSGTRRQLVRTARSGLLITTRTTNAPSVMRASGMAARYGSADPTDLSVPLTCPDWEGARDACDDISLVRTPESRLAFARTTATCPRRNSTRWKPN